MPAYKELRSPYKGASWGGGIKDPNEKVLLGEGSYAVRDRGPLQSGLGAYTFGGREPIQSGPGWDD